MHLRKVCLIFILTVAAESAGLGKDRATAGKFQTLYKGGLGGSPRWGIMRSLRDLT